WTYHMGGASSQATTLVYQSVGIEVSVRSRGSTEYHSSEPKTLATRIRQFGNSASGTWIASTVVATSMAGPGCPSNGGELWRPRRSPPSTERRDGLVQSTVCPAFRPAVFETRNW